MNKLNFLNTGNYGDLSSSNSINRQKSMDFFNNYYFNCYHCEGKLTLLQIAYCKCCAMYKNDNIQNCLNSLK